MTYIMISIFSLLILGLIDPKRSSQFAKRPAIHQIRRVLFSISLLPGIWLLYLQEGAYFLMWLGTLTVAGWLVALSFQKFSGHN